MKYLIYFFVMTVLGAFAGLLIKMSGEGGSPKKQLFSWRLWLGGVLYVLSAVFNILLLRELPYSVVLPLTAITYIWTMLLARWVLREAFSVKKWAGVALILLGVVLIATSGTAN